MFLDRSLRSDWYQHTSSRADVLPFETLVTEEGLSEDTPPPNKRQKYETSKVALVSWKRNLIDTIDTILKNPSYEPTKVDLSKTHPMFAALVSRISESVAPHPVLRKRPVLEVVPRSYEESMMRPPRSNECACTEGVRCECRMMAIENPFESSDGFVGVEFTTPSGVRAGKCVLCLRKATMLAFYENLSNPGSSTRVHQPYRVRCMAGEYSPAVCIRPNAASFNGIVAPFVKHERHHYVYTPEGHIRHGSVVNFRQVKALDDPG